MIGDELRRKLIELIKGNTPTITSVCKVISVNENNLTCTVKSLENDATLNNVRLNAGSTALQTVLIPTVGSAVLVSLIGNNQSARYVAMVSEVDKIHLNGSEHGGLVKVTELTSKLNALESDINTLKQVFTSWVTAPNDGGAALKAASATWAGSALTPTTVPDIENQKITH